MSKIELLVLDPQSTDSAFEVLEEDAGLFGDNGGDPDGPAYIRPYADITPVYAQKVIDYNLGYIAVGEQVAYEANEDGDYPNLNADDVVDWCGYQADGVAYVIHR